VNPWLAVSLFVGELIAIVVLLLAFHERGYKCGVKDGSKAGYEHGRRDADNWWISTEREVDQERQKIWKGEAER
jgi:hypothetical protein